MIDNHNPFVNPVSEDLSKVSFLVPAIVFEFCEMLTISFAMAA